MKAPKKKSSGNRTVVVMESDSGSPDGSDEDAPLVTMGKAASAGEILSIARSEFVQPRVSRPLFRKENNISSLISEVKKRHTDSGVL